MNTFIFSHESDLDGLFSAAIGLMKYPDSKVTFLGNDADILKRIVNLMVTSIRKMDATNLVIISDLALNNNQLKEFKNISERFHTWKFIWLDHHPWQDDIDKNLPMNVELIIDKTRQKCAAELVYERFMLNDQTAKTLSKMAHTMDFFSQDQFITPIPELIVYYKTFDNYQDRLKLLAQKSARGILWDIEMQEDYNKYIVKRDQSKIYSLDNTRIVKLSGLNVAYVPLSPYLQSSIFSKEIFQKFRCDLIVFYSSGGRIGIRRNNNKISCRKIALQLPHGGGHDFAAGGNINKDNPDDIVKEINAAILKSIK